MNFLSVNKPNVVVDIVFVGPFSQYSLFLLLMAYCKSRNVPSFSRMGYNVYLHFLRMGRNTCSFKILNHLSLFLSEYSEDGIAFALKHSRQQA